MIEAVLDKRLLVNLLGQMSKAANKPSGDLPRAASEPPPLDAGERERLREDIDKALHSAATQPAHAEVSDGSSKDPAAEARAFLASTPELANLQSAIEAHVQTNRPALVAAPPLSGRRGGNALITGRGWADPRYNSGSNRAVGPFEPADIRWINSLFAQGMRFFRGKADFVPRPVREQPVPFNDDHVRMVVVGDWGSGVPRAQKVAKAMRVQLDDGIGKNLQQFVIHLGDVYYSGWKNEYRDRFLADDCWPVKLSESGTIGSFNLNGNHDMFSGGHGYYDYALADPRFAPWQGRSSLFQMANSKWQIFGMDTSYEDAAFAGDQIPWMLGAALPGRKTILLSHHQYLTAYEGVSAKVTAAIEPVLQQLEVAGWIWGHEHRCMTYHSLPRLRFANCLGHGGVPVYQFHKEDDAVKAPGAWEYKGYLQSGLERWAKFGFAVLDFHGETLHIRYLDEDGALNHEETVV